MKTIIIVIVVLVIVVLCCLGSTISGIIQDREAKKGETEESDWSPGWLESLGEVAARDLEPDDVRSASPAGCRDELRRGAFDLAPGESCLLRIDDSAWPARGLSLRLTRGELAPLVLDPQGDEVPTKVILRTTGDDRQVDLRILKEGATLTLSCQDGGSSGACRIKVVK